MKFISIPEKYRPSKKFIISISILAGAAVLFFGIRYIAHRVETRNPLAKIKVGELTNPADIDTDNDGLKDWEEALWGTDPKNPDTDANGIPDGRQIQQTRQTLNQQGSDVAIPPEQLTETDKLARDIYTSLAIASQNGELTEEQSVELQGKIIQYIVQRVGGFKEYQTSDFTIVQNSEISARAYASFINGFSDRYNKTIPVLKQTISDLANNTITPEIVSNLGKQQLSFAEELRRQAVPQGLAPQHQYLVNALVRMGTILQGVAVVENDPLTAFINGIGIQDALTNLANAFSALGKASTQ